MVVKNNKKIIFIGSPLPEKMIDEYHTMSFNMADNIAQNVMVKGLHQYYGKNLTVISELSKEYIGDLDLGYGVKAKLISSNGSNKILYYLSLLVNYTRKLNTILKQIDKNTEVIVVTRGSYIFIALPVILARLRFKLKWIPFTITTVEVPEYGFPFNIVSKMSRWTTKRADGMITYVAKSARDYMPGKPFLEMAYSIDDKLIELYKEYKSKRPKKFTIAYTGSLSSTYNFEYIIEAIRKTGDTYRWVFAGTGLYSDQIGQLASDGRFDVNYLGAVSNIDAIKLQKSSHLLLCLKGGDGTKMNQYYSKYAASGKLIEYLCSGTPILLGDIPAFSEKNKSFTTCEQNQRSFQLVTDIESIRLGYNNKLKLAKKGQQYALKHFNAAYQNRSVYEFLESF